jgi:membrane associated rhomboid family serine protease
VATAAETSYCYRHPNRETGLSCSECGRPICTDCATFAPVGIRCPDHSGKPQGVARVATGARRASFEGTGSIVTKSLIAINVAVFLWALATGASLSSLAGPVLREGALFIGNPAIGLAAGEWYRLLTSAFLHGSIIHLALNMLILWMVGAPLEASLGRGRFIAIYLVSGLGGAAGALLLSPDAITVGASGAIFGLFGAALVAERQGTYLLGGSVMGLVIVNFVFTFAFASSGISLGGHLGGFVAGALSMLALTRFGRGHAVYGRPGLLGILGVVAVGAFCLLAAWARVRGYTA